MLRLTISLLCDYSAVDFRGNALSAGDIRTQALVTEAIRETPTPRSRTRRC